MKDRQHIEILWQGNILEGEIAYGYAADSSDEIVLHIRMGEHTFTSQGQHCFAALIGVRKQMEKIGAAPLIMGAHRAVYPSPMQCGMGDGRTAYLQRLEAPAKMADCVDIFAPCALDTVSSVMEQEHFHRLWIASVQKPRESSQ